MYIVITLSQLVETCKEIGPTRVGNDNQVPSVHGTPQLAG